MLAKETYVCEEFSCIVQKQATKSSTLGYCPPASLAVLYTSRAWSCRGRAQASSFVDTQCISMHCGVYCGMYWWYVLNTYQNVFDTNRYVFNTYHSALVCIVSVLCTNKISIPANTDITYHNTCHNTCHHTCQIYVKQ